MDDNGRMAAASDDAAAAGVQDYLGGSGEGGGNAYYPAHSMTWMDIVGLLDRMGASHFEVDGSYTPSLFEETDRG